MEILLLILIVVGIFCLVGKRSHPTHLKGWRAVFSQNCPNCKTPIRGSALFCAHCGQATRRQHRHERAATARAQAIALLPPRPTPNRSRALLLALAAFFVFIVAFVTIAHAQPFYGDPYDGARARQYGLPAPPPLPPAIGAYAAAPLPPPPLGWVYRFYAPCADPSCATLLVSVGADGLNVRMAPTSNSPALLALVNGTPLAPLQREGNWVLVAPLCALVSTWTWSWTAGVPLSVCL
jgi:hypothetical protein